MFGERLRNLRKEHGLTQAELGIKLDLRPSTIGMYEQGRRQPDQATLTKLSRYFSVSLDYLLSDKEGGDQDIEEVIAEIRRRLLANERFTFNGRPLSKSEVYESLQTLEASLKIALLKKNFNNQTEEL